MGNTYQEHLLLDSEQAPGGVLVYYADGDNEIIHANQYVRELLGCATSEEFLELTGGSVWGFANMGEPQEAKDGVGRQAGRGEGVAHMRYRVRAKSGAFAIVDSLSRLVQRPGERPVVYATINAVVQDGTVDLLTGLPSRTRFHELARARVEALRAEGEVPVAVALNLMGIKNYNARWGHEKGDQLLCAFADVLRRHFGERSCSRFAEDHFYAIDSASGIEQKLEALYADHQTTSEDALLPVRTGVYACEPDDDVATVGFDRAKLACDVDRSTWQSHTTWFTDEMRSSERRRIHLLESMDQAMELGWIRPYYQPIVRVATGDVCGEEALARWVDAEYGSLMPGEFFSVVDEAGLSHKLDLHIVACVLADMNEKKRAGIPVVPVSVNISSRDLMQVNMPQELSRLCDEAGISHDLLRVELSEADTIDLDLVNPQVMALHEAGFQVWMDDFGSGSTSLNVMRWLKFDLVKLDMSLLHGMETKKSRLIVEGIIQTAGKLGVGTIAEGVETREQALFLESVGCDMLQGYYFGGPGPHASVCDMVTSGRGYNQEAIGEDRYWEDVSLINLAGFSTMMEPEVVDDSLTMEFPAGVFERREGTWRALRLNHACEGLLRDAGVLPKDYSRLKANVLEGNESQGGFDAAAERALGSNSWERIAGCLEYGSGFQFYLRPVARTARAEAFMMLGVPTLLGTALGTYGDVPVAYAVFHVVLDEKGEEVVDVEYVYANATYCDWGGIDQEEIVGHSFRETIKDASSVWFPYSYRAAIKGEHVHDIVYSPEIGHWLSFYVAPATIPGYCVYAFAMVDDERRERNEIIVGRDTSNIIIDVANALFDESRYDVAMNELLSTMSSIVSADRLFVYERGDETSSNTFEWCADGVEPRIAARQHIPNADFDAWARALSQGGMTVISDVEDLARVDYSLYERFRALGVHRMLMVSCCANGELVGYLGADNYAFEGDLDARRLLKTVASFIGAKIANHRLVNTLEHASMRDGLTGLLNRRGIDTVVAERLGQVPHERFVLALMDVDDFKTVNDLNGHDVGDEALRRLARVVTAAFPAGTIVGRNGGDEFLAMMVGDDVAQADRIIGELSELDKSFVYGGRRYHLSMSIGYAECPADAVDLQSTYSRADAALYAVKLSGKSGCSRYTPQMEVQYRSQLGFTPRDIAENVPGAILVHQPGGDGAILFANKELIDLFECDDLADFMAYTGGVFSGVVHPDDHERVRDELAAQMTVDDVGQKDFVDFRILGKRGRVRHVANNGRLIEVEGMGKVFYELMIDRTEREVL